MDILDSLHPLKDLERLKESEKHDPIAQKHFSTVELIQEELLWTGRPIQKFSRRDQLELGALMLFFFALILVFFSSYAFPTTQLFIKGFFFLVALPFIWLFLLLHEKKRKQTFYGVSATSIWMHPYQSTLQQYPIKALKELKEHEQNIIFFTEDGYQITLQHIPHSYKVVQLIQSLQQTPSTTSDDRTAG